jgi:hypothetical protein
VLYSVEQLPRCDLLRLSPRSEDSSCRLDEPPAHDQMSVFERNYYMLRSNFW